MGRRRRRRRRRGSSSSAGGLKNTTWGAQQGDLRGGGFTRVQSADAKSGPIVVNCTTPQEMGDKLDIDWEDTEKTRGKMFWVHVHRLAGPLPEIKRKTREDKG